MSTAPPPESALAAEGASARLRALVRPFLSVVIPTFRRRELLERVLDELTSQLAHLDEVAEVIVCDDASGDGTPAWLAGQAEADRLPLAWLELRENGGPARARNQAMSRARGMVILLLGDDIVPAPDLLTRHCRWHREHPEPTDALLGRTTWPPDRECTPFMRFLEGGGRALFLNYADLPPGRVVSGMAFYTCNVSFKRALSEAVGGFDESFPFASHEDLEFGLRLQRAGLRLVYDPGALGHHWHALDFPGSVRRIYRMGCSSVLFWQRLDRQGGAPNDRGSGGRGGVLRRCFRRVLAAAFGLRFKRRALLAAARRAPSWPKAWRVLLHGVYWAGYADGLRGRTDPLFMDFPR